MEYREIELKVVDDGIYSYKAFHGIKIFSRNQKSEDGTKILSQRVDETAKKNYVYYQRTDVNWNYWNDKTKYDADFVPEETVEDILFVVLPNLDGIEKYLDKRSMEILKEKVKGNKIVEHLDI